jgi:hypothetical protein
MLKQSLVLLLVAGSWSLHTKPFVFIEGQGAKALNFFRQFAEMGATQIHVITKNGADRRGLSGTLWMISQFSTDVSRLLELASRHEIFHFKRSIDLRFVAVEGVVMGVVIKGLQNQIPEAVWYMPDSRHKPFPLYQALYGALERIQASKLNFIQSQNQGLLPKALTFTRAAFVAVGSSFSANSVEMASTLFCAWSAIQRLFVCTCSIRSTSNPVQRLYCNTPHEI